VIVKGIIEKLKLPVFQIGILVVLFCNITTVAIAQTTFNLRDSLGYSNTAYGGVVETDSFFVVSGTFADASVAENSHVLSFYSKEGFLERKKTLAYPTKSISQVRDALITTLDNNFAVLSTIGENATLAISLIKFNANGDTIFTKNYSNVDTIGGYGYIRAEQIIEVPDSGFILLCTYDLVSKFKIGIIRVDKDGDEMWRTIYSTPTQLEDFPQTISMTSDGGFLIGAWRTNVRIVSSNFTSQSYILKTDSLGTIEWEYSSPMNELRSGPTEMIYNELADVIIYAGASGFEYVNGPNAQLEFEPEVYAVSSGGTEHWSISSPSDSPFLYPSLTNIVRLPNGSIVVGGQVYKLDSTGTVSESFGHLIKLNPQGQVEWRRDYSHPDLPHGYGDVYLNDLKATLDGGFIFCGEARIALTSVPTPQQSWLVKVDEFGCLVLGCQFVSTEELEPTKTFAFKAGPIPANQQLNVYLTAKSNGMRATVSIIGMDGRVHQQQEVQLASNNITFTLGTAALPIGIYLLRIEDEQGSAQTQRIQILH